MGGGGHNNNHGKHNSDSHSNYHDSKKDHDKKKEDKDKKEHKEPHSSFARSAILNSVQQGLERLTVPAAMYLAKSPWIRPLIAKIRSEKPKSNLALKQLITDFAAGFGGTGAKEFILFFFRKFPFISRILDADEIAEIGEEVLADFIKNLQAAIEVSEKIGNGTIYFNDVHDAAMNAVAPLAEVVCFRESGPARRLHDIECPKVAQEIRNMHPISRTAFMRLKGQKVSFDPNCCGDLAEANLKEVKLDAPAQKVEEPELTSVVETMSYLIEHGKHGVKDTHRDAFLFWIATLSEDDTRLLNKVADRKREVAELLIAKDDDQRTALLKGMKSRDFATKIEDASDKFSKDNKKIAEELRAKAAALRAQQRGEDPAPKPAEKLPEEIAPELTATAEDGKVTLFWSPAVTKKGTVTHYVVETADRAGFEVADDVDKETSFIKTGLTNGTRYFFLVRVFAGPDEVAISAVSSAMPKAAPAAPAGGPIPNPVPPTNPPTPKGPSALSKIGGFFKKFVAGDY